MLPYSQGIWFHKPLVIDILPWSVFIFFCFNFQVIQGLYRSRTNFLIHLLLRRYSFHIGRKKFRLYNLTWHKLCYQTKSSSFNYRSCKITFWFVCFFFFFQSFIFSHTVPKVHFLFSVSRLVGVLLLFSLSLGFLIFSILLHMCEISPILFLCGF